MPNKVSNQVLLLSLLLLLTTKAFSQSKDSTKKGKQQTFILFGGKRIKELTQKNDSLIHRIDSLNQYQSRYFFKIDSLSRIVSSLRDSVRIFINKINSLETDAAEQKREYGILKRNDSLSKNKNNSLLISLNDTVRNDRIEIAFLKNRLAQSIYHVDSLQKAIYAYPPLGPIRDSIKVLKSELEKEKKGIITIDDTPALRKLCDTGQGPHFKINVPKLVISELLDQKPAPSPTLPWYLLAASWALFMLFFIYKFYKLTIIVTDTIYCKISEFDNDYVTAWALLDSGKEDERIQERVFERKLIDDILP